MNRSLSWRITLFKEGMYVRWARIILIFRWAFRSIAPRIKPHNLSSKLIISLTSYPPRYRTLGLTIKCLLTQTIRSNKVVLWIADDDVQKLPASVLKLQKYGLEIRKTADLRSYKKIIPALDEFPDAYICTADDDVYYRASWLKHLINGVDAAKKVVACHRAISMEMNSTDGWAPYLQWPLAKPDEMPSIKIFPTGVGGIIYPPNALTHTMEDRKIFSEFCANNDDIWLYWIGRRNGASYKLVNGGYQVISWKGSQNEALWKDNVFAKGNDRQIEAITKVYGLPW